MLSPKQKQYTLLLLGAAILAFGLYNVHSQSNITEGGILGITLLLNHWFHISPGITGICLDIICYLFAFKLLGKSFLKKAMIVSIGFSIFYNIFEYFGYVLPSLDTYPLAASVIGGMFVGLGVGLVVRYGGAAGGDDALALIITKLNGCTISKAYFFADFVVLMLSLSYIPMMKIAYSLLSVTISSFIIGRLHVPDKIKITQESSNLV